MQHHPHDRGRTLDDMAGWLPAAGTAFLRSGREMANRFTRYLGAVQRAAVLGAALLFDLALVAPALPPCSVGPGHTEASWLREPTLRGAADRYGPEPDNLKAYRQLAYELDVIKKLDFPGYYLIVHGLVEFCRTNNILCQGRGSAANSAVCYATPTAAKTNSSPHSPASSTTPSGHNQSPNQTWTAPQR